MKCKKGLGARNTEALVGGISYKKHAANSASEARAQAPSARAEPHPLANLFPLLEGEELAELVADIAAHGLLEPIIVHEGKILDGRNRYRACLAAGARPWFKPFDGTDPLAFVISANIRRRHLSADDKRDLIAKLIKADPAKSNRRIADQVKVSHPHVAKVRAELETTGDVETVTTSIDTKGRQQPAKPAKTKGPVASRRAASEEQEIEEGFKQFGGDLGAALGCKVEVVGRQQPAKHKSKPPAGNDCDPQGSAEQRKAEADTLEQTTANESASRTYSVEEWETLAESDRKGIIAEAIGNSQFNAQSNDSIEWARWSWNPVTGCLHNCPYCYARDIAERFFERGFEPTFLPDRLVAPRNTKVPKQAATEIGFRNVFVCSMADLFGKWVPEDWIAAVFDQVRAHPQWNFLFLTKFPQRLAERQWPVNAWCGTTVDTQARVKIAERAFRDVKAGVRWLSVEPMMERLTFTSLEMFNWIVLGGATRSTQTPAFDPPMEWVLHLLQQAQAAGIESGYAKANLRALRGYPTLGVAAEPPRAAP